MCYIVETHTLQCDVRPLVSDGDQALVDVFEKPACCDCKRQPQADRAYECGRHGCCTLRLKMAWCCDTENCTESKRLHHYVQRGPVGSCKDWKPMRSMEEILFPETGLPHLCEMTSRLRKALVGLIWLGRHISHHRATISKLRRLLTVLIMERRRQKPCSLDLAAIGNLKNALAGARETLEGLSRMFRAELLFFHLEWRQCQDWVSVAKVVATDKPSATFMANNCLNGMASDLPAVALFEQLNGHAGTGKQSKTGGSIRTLSGYGFSP